ncbi:alpha/beta hydrolase [Undibacterium flavidum]|uniref:Alpha/beta fold hydrolase n=1 Tax=Undibacterium flavidum TaxID=2762297 RepID=A0ABR6YHC8_9BURK|nr:alpha/beta fold hydrolase [Undibacterium flavidum]MBC3875984.1 alpha/beta fold hydrolase [Undibacterium flavidum]
MPFPSHRSPFLSRQVRTIVAIAASLLFTSLAYADELITLKTRPGVTQSVLLWEPHGPAPKTVILLIPGGSGNIGLKLKDGQAQAEATHLFSRQHEALLQKQFAVAVIDAPSDQEDMTQDFRTSARHAADMQAVIRKIRSRFPKARLVLVAHSRGTVSAGYIAQNRVNKVNAVVLLSGLYQASQPGPLIPSPGPGLSKIDLPSLKIPMLLVHHTLDACPVSSFSAASDVSTRLPMMTVNGANAAEGSPLCGPGSNHWFVGMEEAVGQQIINWLSGKTWKSNLP